MHPAPKGIRFERVPHPNPAMVAFSKKSPTSAYRVYHRSKVVGIVCQVPDRVEYKDLRHSPRYTVRWLPIAPGRSYQAPSELYKDTRSQAALRLVEIAEMGKAFG
jgi:hypothetical protein